MEYIVLGVIGVIFVGFIIFAVKRRNGEALLNFTLRMFGGTLAIYLMNCILNRFDLGVQVGINAYNLLTVGILGSPGVLLLYGLSTYFTLKA